MMPSKENPFPGMNPYLERSWPDVHTRLIAEISNVLGQTLPDGLVARAEEAVAIDATRERVDQGFRVDVGLVERESWRYGNPPEWKEEEHRSSEGLVASQPEVMRLEEIPQRWVEIRTTSGKVVTLIEVISPATRKWLGFERYKRKQLVCLESSTNLVEIDLIREGHPVIQVPEERLYQRDGTHYFVCAYRNLLVQRELYPCPLRERLPVIAIPLRPEDRDALIDLQPLVDRCYRLGGYWQNDYRHDPEPPLLPDELRWLDERLRAAGLRN